MEKTYQLISEVREAVRLKFEGHFNDAFVAYVAQKTLYESALESYTWYVMLGLTDDHAVAYLNH